MSTNFDLIPTQDYVAICNAIRAKDKSTAQIKSGEAANKISNLITMDQLISDSLTSISSDLPTVKSYAFAGSKNLTKITLSNLTSVPEGCFASCACQQIDIPLATTIGDSAFMSTPLPSLINDRITSVGEKSFYECHALKEVILENLLEAGESAFYYCKYLEKVSLPKLKILADRTFQDDWSLREANLPEVESVGYDSFAYSDFQKGYFEKLKKIDRKAFQSSHLDTLILKNETMCQLTDSSCLQKTPISEGKGFIYVPKNLLSTYQADPIWGLYSNQIRAIEDYPDICNNTTIDASLFQEALRDFEGRICFSKEASPVTNNFLNFKKTVNYKIDNNVATIYCIEPNKEIYAPLDCSHFFQNFKAKIIDCTNLNFKFTEKATHMFNITYADSIFMNEMPSLLDAREMFQNVTSHFVDISKMSNNIIEDMEGMFSYCTINNIDFSSFNTVKATNTARMFEHFTTNLDMNCSNFNVSQVSNMQRMFRKTKAPSIDISNFDTSSNPTMTEMFDYTKTNTITCKSQEEIDRYKANGNPQPDLNFVIKQ